MSYRNEIAGIWEAELVTIFDDLNYRFFNNRLDLPDALAWDYRNNRAGGETLSSKDGSHCYYIVVRGKQRGNDKHVRETMLHEMVHQSVSLQFSQTELPSLNYKRSDFANDKSAAFMLEGARISQLYGCSFSTFQSWSSEESPDQETHITSNTYTQLQDAKSLLGSLSA